MVGRAGESVVLGCDLLPPAGRPPLHVIEWLRFGFLLPIFIQFGLYSPRIDPDYVGKTCPQVGGWKGLATHQQKWAGGGGQDPLTALPPLPHCLAGRPGPRGGWMHSGVAGSVTCLLLPVVGGTLAGWGTEEPVRRVGWRWLGSLKVREWTDGARLGSCFRWLLSSVQASQGQGRRLLHPCWLPQRPQIPPNPRWSLNLSGLGLQQAGRSAGRQVGGQ